MSPVAASVINAADITLGAALTGVIWVLISWPLWDRLVSSHNCNPMVMLPFLVSAAGMLPPCYENMMENLFSGSWAALCSTLLAFATLVQFHQVTSLNSIVIGLTGMVFLVKALVMHRGKRCSHLVKDALTGTKIAAACGVAALMAWLIPYLDGPTWEKLVTHALVGTALIGGILVSLASGRQTRKFGIGVPLAWTVVRIFSTGGVPYFYYWGLYGTLIWVFLNICSKHGNLWAPSKHWDYWTLVRASSTPWLMTISIYIVILAGSGTLSVTEGNLSGQLLNRQMLSEAPEKYNLTQFENYYLRTLSIPGILPTHHYIYESPICLINGALLLGNAGTIYLHEVQGGSISGHVWQAVLFLVVLFSGFYYERTNSEFILESIRMMKISWTNEAVSFFCLCAVGCLISLWSAINMREIFSRKVAVNMMYLPTLMGTMIVALIIGARLLALWPEGDIRFKFSEIPTNQTDYGDLVGYPNNWQSLHSLLVSAGNPELRTDISSMVFIELVIVFGTLVMAGIMLVGAIWFPYLGTMMVIIDAVLALWMATAVISKLVALQKTEFLGSSYELFVTVLAVSTVLCLAVGIAFRIRIAIEMSKYDWVDEKEMMASYERSEACNLRQFLINVKKVDIGEIANEKEAFEYVMNETGKRDSWSADPPVDDQSVDSLGEDPDSRVMMG